jgi:hypothetical protein
MIQDHGEFVRWAASALDWTECASGCEANERARRHPAHRRAWFDDPSVEDFDSAVLGGFPDVNLNVVLQSPFDVQQAFEAASTDVAITYLDQGLRRYSRTQGLIHGTLRSDPERLEVFRAKVGGLGGSNKAVSLPADARQSRLRQGRIRNPGQDPD